MSKLEVMWAPLLLPAVIAVESFFLRTAFFPLMHQPLPRRATDMILVLIRPTAEALVSPGIQRRRARTYLVFSTSMYAAYVITT